MKLNGRLHVTTTMASSPSSERVVVSEETMKAGVLPSPVLVSVSPTTGWKLKVTQMASHWIRDHLPTALPSPSQIVRINMVLLQRRQHRYRFPNVIILRRMRMGRNSNVIVTIADGPAVIVVRPTQRIQQSAPEVYGHP
jgi:hypothetical protein